MTSEEFLTQLEGRQWLSAPFMERLHAKVADSGRSLDAKTLAKFLVDKGHLTPAQIKEIMGDGEKAKPLAPVSVEAASPKIKDRTKSRKTVDLADESVDLGEAAEPLETKKKSRGSSKSKSKKTLKKTNEWDSPLLLAGGGTLALLLLCGVAVGYFLFRESGDEILTNAQTAMQSGSYSQAVELYKKFVTDFPRHPGHGEARVNLALARLRKDTELQDYKLALETAQTEISAVEDEEKFATTAQGELTALLPKIAQGLATAAEQEQDSEKVAEQTKLAEAALALCSNTQYIPKSMRGPEIVEVQATLDRIARRQKAMEALNAALATMEQANTAGDSRASYEAYEKLLKSNPELTGNEKLLAMVAKTSQAEQKGIAFVEESQAALTAAAESPVVAELALAYRRIAGTASATGVAAIQVEGVIYGFDVASGKLLWRRFVGVSGTPMQPVAFEGDLLCVGSNGNELMRLNQANGELLWRVPLKDSVTQPIITGKRAFLAGESGRLHVVELVSGNLLGFVKFSQPLRTPPVADSSGKRLYLAGDHSSLYTLSVDDLKCLGVHYLGHDRGSVASGPAVVLNKLAISENDGAESSLIHLFELDADGIIAKKLVEKRLSGLVTQQPMVDGRRLVVTTDRGQVNVYDITSSADESALNLIASREASRRQPLTSTTSLAAGHLWVADNQLTKFSVDPTSTRITVRDVAESYANSAFIAPPLVYGDVIVHARKRSGDSSITVTATDGKAGATLWETVVALQPAGSPANATNTRGLVQATADGKVFLFDRNAISARVQDSPLPGTATPSTAKPLEYRLVLPDGKIVFSAKSSPDVLLYDPAGGEKSLRWFHLPSPLACEPTLFGTGWIAPLEVGQVLYLDGAGQSLAAPFQPTLKPGVSRNWFPAAAINDKSFVVTDGIESIQLVELRPTPQPHLAAVKDAALGATRVTSRPAVISEKTFAGAKDSRLAVFALPTLEPGDPISLSGEVTWGPFVVKDHVIVATADGKLSAVAANGTVSWQQAIEQIPLGAPLEQGDTTLLTFADGRIVKVQLADGKEAGQVNVGQSLASCAVVFEQRFAVATTDGAVLILNVP